MTPMGNYTNRGETCAGPDLWGPVVNPSHQQAAEHSQAMRRCFLPSGGFLPAGAQDTVDPEAAPGGGGEDGDVRQDHQIVGPVPFIGCVQDRQSDRQRLGQPDHRPKPGGKPDQQERTEASLDEQRHPTEKGKIRQHHVFSKQCIGLEYRALDRETSEKIQSVVRVLTKVWWHLPRNVLNPQQRHTNPQHGDTPTGQP